MIQTQVLSGSTNGRPIPVAATATPGTLIHTAVNITGAVDQLFLYATNTDTTDRKLTLEWGGVTAPNDLSESTIPPEGGLRLIAAGVPLSGGLVVRAFAASASVINIVGYVKRIFQAA